MLDLLFELCWQLGFAHPDKLSEQLTTPQLAGWIAWLRRQPRGERRLDALMAIQTAAIRAAWVEKPESPEGFMPQWFVADATSELNEAERLLSQFGLAQRLSGI